MFKKRAGLEKAAAEDNELRRVRKEEKVAFVPTVPVRAAKSRERICVREADSQPRESGQDNSQPLVGERGLNTLVVKDSEDRGVDTAVGHDHLAILQRNEEIGRKILAGELERGIYRGKGAYAPAMNRREGALSANKYTGVYGQLRSTNSQYAKTTTRTDYNPEICKDYNETGYCGFGDTCKFIHDRYDYKAGWQIENEWEAKQKKRQIELKQRLEGIVPNRAEGSDSDSSD